ncbi:uncharacterized protein BDZ99DRAFT_571333 [Mytilinidion resinicola]|uniref:Uncharacterized protein n=1 Tax=Mytilinidion resinicola TaxID=574789 RepID=A0A6A6YLT7_9PEZI|nr:uncharacterized protein BDZ99DRAFT_571333 [Mytilinidion resinicola]KAF2809533.1 hypothetical protein BDZ99DRAFT_571333 [Mytilinidion resinicola]
MTDSPAVRIPLDPREQPILDKLLSIRTDLELLKGDRSTYVKSEDVVALYNQLIEQVAVLNELRTNRRNEQNRVDTVLDDCFQLISLSFLTIGKNHEAPAVYSAISTIKRLLEHLKEAAFFSPKDLESISTSLQKSRDYCERGRESYSPNFLTLLEARIQVCQDILSELELSLSHLTPELRPKYDKLVSILRSLSACNTRSKFPTAEVEDFRQQLVELQESFAAEGVVLLETEGTIDEQLAEMARKLKLSLEHPEPAPDAKNLIATLLSRCFLWIELIKQKQGKIDERFQETYDKLLEIRNKLEKLSLTQAWSLRETDLYSYQRQLDRIDEARVNGNFLDASNVPADLHAQRTLLYLLRKSYAIIYHLIISSEPVSEALLPIYNQLNTLKRCLVEVKKSGGIDSPRELYPYSMKLNSIDNMRVDGKFMVGSDIPDGQGSVTQLLEDCFELLYELRTEAEENQSDSEDDLVAKTEVAAT